jgi:hypothetical protein
MKEFEDRLYDVARERPTKTKMENQTLDSKQVVHLLEEALDSGKITDGQFRSNIKITFLTAHENVQQLMNSTFWELGKNQVRHKIGKPRCMAGLTGKPGGSASSPGGSPPHRNVHAHSRIGASPTIPHLRCL